MMNMKPTAALCPQVQECHPQGWIIPYPDYLRSGTITPYDIIQVDLWEARARGLLTMANLEEAKALAEADTRTDLM